jgi:hypothetical protein
MKGAQTTRKHLKQQKTAVLTSSKSNPAFERLYNVSKEKSLKKQIKIQKIQKEEGCSFAP